MSDDIRDINPGLYKIYWKSGGSSLATIGLTVFGNYWFAPSNWTSGIPSMEWGLIKAVEPIKTENTGLLGICPKCNKNFTIQIGHTIKPDFDGEKLIMLGKVFIRCPHCKDVVYREAV